MAMASCLDRDQCERDPWEAALTGTESRGDAGAGAVSIGPSRCLGRWACGASWLKELHWVICGGESGPGFRPMEADWARELRDQCRIHRVTVFHETNGKGKAPIPADLLVREYPTAAPGAAGLHGA